MSSVYTDVIEGYLIATIKVTDQTNANQVLFQLVGWFTFGTFLILKGAFLNAVYDSSSGGYSSTGYGRNFGGGSLTDQLGVTEEEAVYKLPWVEKWTVS